MKNVVIGKTAGFCGGVMLCTKNLTDALNENKNLYCIGDVVHNKDVVNFYKEKGLIVVDDLDQVPDNSKCVIRAHGAKKSLYEIAQKRNISLIDLTCPKVLKIRSLIKGDTNKDDTLIILFGEKSHPEVQSTASFCGKNVEIVENEDDVNKIVNRTPKFKNYIVISQTTYNETLFNKYCLILKDSLSNVKIINTICDATSKRQNEVISMAKEYEAMIIIGGRNSSNSQKLYDLSKMYCPNTFFIENVLDLDIDSLKSFQNIGIMAGASTPSFVIDKVYQKIVSL